MILAPTKYQMPNESTIILIALALTNCQMAYMIIYLIFNADIINYVRFVSLIRLDALLHTLSNVCTCRRVS